MKSRFTLILALIFCLVGGNILNAKAQKNDDLFLINESFDTWPAENWTLTAAGDEGSWIHDDVALSAKHADDERNCIDWMISPKFTVGDQTQLSFLEKNVDAFYIEHHGLYISVGSDDPADDDFVLISEFKADAPDFTKREIDLSAYAGQEACIAFLYKGNYQSFWWIDEVKVFNPANLDVQVTDVNYFGAPVSASPIRVETNITNKGLSAASSVKVQLLDGEKLLQEQSIDLAIDETKTVSFNEFYLYKGINLTVKAILEGDQIEDNNSMDLAIPFFTNPAYGYVFFSGGDLLEKGPIVFDMTNPGNIAYLEHKPTHHIASSVMIDGNWYAYTFEDVEDKGEEARAFVSIDRYSGETTKIADANEFIKGMSYDKTNNTLYGITHIKEGECGLFTIDVTTGEATKVADQPTDGLQILSIAIDKDGNAFGVSDASELYAIDLSTFECTLIGTCPFIIKNYTQSMTFDRLTNKLYMTVYSAFDSEFYEINTTDATASKIGDFPQFAQITGFEIYRNLPSMPNALVEESFNSWPPENWTLIAVGDDGSWIQDVSSVDENPGSAKHADDDRNCIDWLTTPMFVAAERSALSFYEKNADAFYAEHHGIYVIDPSQEAPVLLADLKEDTPDWTKREYDLSAYAGKAIAIGFLYKGNYASSWWIDDVKVLNPLPDDVEINDLEYKGAPIAMAPIKVQATITNKGLNAANGVNIQLYKGDEVVEEISVDLAVEEQKTVEFSDISLWNEDANYTVKAVYAADMDMNNNEISKSLELIENAGYGYVYFSGGGLVDKGLVVFDLDTPDQLIHLPNSIEGDLASSIYMKNKWYGYTSETIEDKGEEVKAFVRMDFMTGETTKVADADVFIKDMAFNAADNMVYGITHIKDGACGLYTIDLTSGAATEVAAQPTENLQILTIAIDAEGNAFGVSDEADLYSINLSNFECTLIGKCPFSIKNYTQSMSFDTKSGLLIMSVYSVLESELYVINTSDASVTKVGDFPQMSQITGFEILRRAEHKLTFDLTDLKNTEIDNEGVTIDLGLQQFEITDLEAIDYNYVIEEVPEGLYNYNILVKDAENTTQEGEVSLVEEMIIKLNYMVNVDEIASSEFNVFPNPAQNLIKLEVNEEGIANIFDVNGQLMISTSIEAGENTIDVSKLTSGLYLIRINSNEAQAVSKFLKK